MDMKKLVIVDFDELTRVLEDTSLMSPVYKHFLSGRIVKAKVKYYSHPGGVRIRGMNGRYWVYVELTNNKGMEYDAALWKILNEALSYPVILLKVMKYVEVE